MIKNNLHHKIALLWLLIVSILLIHSGYLLLHKRISFNTDILALLPAEQRDPVIQIATDHMFNTVQQQVAVLVGAKTWSEAVRAANAYTAVIHTRPDLLQNSNMISGNIQNNYLDIFLKSRLGLLTLKQQSELKTQSSQYWVNSALSSLYNPFSGPKLVAWQDDPFGLFSNWIQERAQETPVRPRDGKLFIADNTHNYVVILMNIVKPAFSMSNQEAVIPLLDAAKLAAQKAVLNTDIISTGVILHAAFGSQEASHEMSTIAVGSLLGIIILMLVIFRSLKPILLIGLSIGVGCLGALSLCWVLLGQIHLLTLVFGASLIGVAQDYSIYFLCSRLGAEASVSSRELLKQLWPSLILTLTAAIIGYMGLALTPFPALRQMALFSGLGLVFAWLTVVCWFPIFIKPHTLKATQLAKFFDASLNHWPAFRLNKLTLVVSLLFFVFIIIGFSKLTVSDDIRSLQNPPKTLINDQIKFSQLLDAPTLVQFYLVRGATEQIVLQREEVLKLELQNLIHQHIITGYQAISNWVPSIQLQKTNQKLVEQKLLSHLSDINKSPLENLANKIGENSVWVEHIRDRLLDNSAILTPDIFLNSSISLPWRFLWLGNININNTSQHHYASIVTIKGLHHYHDLEQLKNISPKIPGVKWVDKINEISSILGHYRQYMSWVVLGAYIAIYFLLFIRYRTAAWRVMMPPAVASISTIALLGIFGLPLQLFHILALMLILGLGVDYGIFLQEKSTYNWLTIGLSAISALLSFGLLALSNTPPLHAFGLTMLIGMTIVWLISPCFRNPNEYQ